MNRWIQNIRHERLPSQFVTELSDVFLSFPLLQPLLTRYSLLFTPHMLSFSFFSLSIISLLSPFLIQICFSVLFFLFSLILVFMFISFLI